MFSRVRFGMNNHFNPRRMTKIFTSLVGRPDSESGAAQDFRAEQQLCPTGKAKNSVAHPNNPARVESSLQKETGRTTIKPIMTITELLRTEHAAFNAILNEIEAVLPSVATLGELRILVCVMAGFLQQHGRKEEELLYPALDQMQAQRGRLDEMTREHGELDEQIRQAANNRNLGKARQQLGRLIQAVREHFEHEERHLFPLAEEVLQAENLVALGSAAQQTAVQLC
jgi:hemerythrin-like domain-containing protein